MRKTKAKESLAPAKKDDYKADLFIIERPAKWKPKNWRDSPPEIRTLWREHQDISLEDALAIQFGFNTAAIDEAGKTWACVTVAWRMETDA